LWALEWAWHIAENLELRKNLRKLLQFMATAPNNL